MAASGYIEHLTAEGDRWDLLAWHYYGDATRYEEIILANPALPIIPILPAGVKVLIPVADDPAPAVDAGLPPWVTYG
jgi:phage tail protein X